MLLEGRGLCFTYPNSQTKVLDNLDFTIQEPGFHALFGPSGAGKSSLARMIASNTINYQGTIISKDIDIILYSYNLERLPGWTTLATHLDAVVSQDKKALRDELTKAFGLQEMMQARFMQLSLGQRNRINLLRYLLQDFDLLIMDESLANVEEKLRETIILLIKQYFPTKMFLCISHNLLEVAKFCQQIIVLRSGATNCQVLQGLDCREQGSVDKGKLDTVMLEIINAC